MIPIFQILILAVIQGAAELLPVSSSAHVIVAEKLMGLDPSAPEMTFLLVMLHTGTMFAVLLYFWPRWRKLKLDFFKNVIVATVSTGIVGFGLKKLIEKVILEKFLGESHAEIEMLFKSLPLISAALFSVGIFILYAAMREKKAGHKKLTQASALRIGMVQGLCLPFRGFSRSGATISSAMLQGISRELAEEFSFALAVVLTPPVIVWEFYRLLKKSPAGLGEMVTPGLLGMVFSFGAGLIALKCLSATLENGRWKYFGFYCLVASGIVLSLQWSGIV